LNSIFERLRVLVKKPGVTVAELEPALKDATDALEQSKGALRDAEADYQASLLDETPTAATRAREKANTAEIARDRSAALVRALTAQLAHARIEEAKGALTAEREAADREAKAVVKLIRARYPAIATELTGMLHRLTEAEKAILSVNDKLAVAERVEERLSGVESRMFLAPHHRSILDIINLPHFDDGFAPGWNDHNWKLVGPRTARAA
jgi:hypothetical protein